MKTCTKCKQPKEVSLFPKKTKSADGLAPWCKECYAAHAAEKYRNDPAEKARKSRNRQSFGKLNQGKMWDYLSQQSCVDCGNSDPRVLEFDHKDEAAKQFNICDKLWALSWQRILDEIAKCDVRCANCHRIRTQDQFSTWRGTMGR